MNISLIPAKGANKNAAAAASLEKGGEAGADLQPCPKCSVQPKEETKVFELGHWRDGGYSVLIGRYVCPMCGFGQTWGQSYSVHYGWDANERVWNNLVSKYERRRESDG